MKTIIVFLMSAGLALAQSTNYDSLRGDSRVVTNEQDLVALQAVAALATGTIYSATYAGAVTGVQSGLVAGAAAHTNRTDNPHTTTLAQASTAGGFAGTETITPGKINVPGYLEVAVAAGYIVGHQNVVIGNTNHVSVTDAISLADFGGGAHLMAGLETTGLFMLDYYDGAITNDWSIQSATGSHMLWIHCLQHPTWPVQFQNPVSIVGGASPVLTSDNTVVCPNLNADLLDGYHLSGITPEQIGGITTNQLNAATNGIPAQIAASNAALRAACIYAGTTNALSIGSASRSAEWSVYLTTDWTVPISPAMSAGQQFDLGITHSTINHIMTWPAGIKIQTATTGLTYTNSTGFTDWYTLICRGTNATLGTLTTNLFKLTGLQ